MTRFLTFALVLLAPAVSLAVPLQVAHQGELHDLAGPVTDTVSVTFELFEAVSGGDAVWTEVRDVDVIDGHYVVLLGSELQSNPIEDVLALEPELWLQITVEGEELEPRQLLGSAPYAIVANTAVNVDGGTVNASSVSINGNQVIGGSGLIDWSAISGAPTDADTLAGLSCANGARPTWTGSVWDCDLVTWGELQGIPSGFADEVDDDTLASLGLLCTDGDRAMWDFGLGDWACVSEEVGLERLDMAGATEGQVLTFDGASISWAEPVAASTACEFTSDDGVSVYLSCDGTPLALPMTETYVEVEGGVGLTADGALVDLRHGTLLVAGGVVGFGGIEAIFTPVGDAQEGPVVFRLGCAALEASAGSGLDCWGPTSWAAAVESAAGSSQYQDVACVQGSRTVTSTTNSGCCALQTSGVIACWDASGTDLPDVPAGSFESLAASSGGGVKACGLTSAGAISCTSYHQSNVPGGSGFSGLAAQGGPVWPDSTPAYFCAVDSAGQPWQWSTWATEVVVLPGGTYTALGNHCACGLTSTGEIHCQGDVTYSGSFTAIDPTGPWALRADGSPAKLMVGDGGDTAGIPVH